MVRTWTACKSDEEVVNQVAEDRDIPAPRRLIAVRGRRDVLLTVGLALVSLDACTRPAEPIARAPATLPTAQPPSSAPLPFDEAVLTAANAIFSSATVADRSGAVRQPVVIDPLVDGVTGEQSAATQTIGARIAALAREKYPQFAIEPFGPQAVSRLPYVIVGTFTPVNARNVASGDREAYRFCLIMADLRSGKVVARAWVRARLEGVDASPTAFFRDSPAWTDDAQMKGYIDTCQETHVGDPISPVYLEGIVAASIISEAIDAYTAGRYRDAADLYGNARASNAGNQLRVYNGLYLANWKLGRQEAAATAFGEAVDFGLANRRLGLKILFRPGSVALDPGADAQPYDMWMEQIAIRTARNRACLQVTGNTSRTGTAALNDRLFGLRANYIKERLEADDPGLNGRLIATGVGANANLIGTGADDATDALDRRVEFKVIPQCG
jgi:outer membrane protein OmpA-like peptidoglycan-associated protein